jgi:membrane-associated protein
MIHWLEPLTIIKALGMVGVWGVIFAESGLFFGFFLPGDSLLFTAGFLASQGLVSALPLWLGAALAAVLGDMVGFWFGRRAGPKIFHREDSFFFNKNHIARTQSFYERYGKKTIVLARFVPVVRTFAPILAGVAGMNYRYFARYNIAGGVAWVSVFIVGGWGLGSLLPNAEQYLTLIIGAIVVFSFGPAVWHLWREGRHSA